LILPKGCQTTVFENCSL